MCGCGVHNPCYGCRCGCKHAEQAITRVNDLYHKTCHETVNGCSSDLEVFLNDLREALDGKTRMLALDGPFVGKDYSKVPDRVESLVDHYMDYSTGEVYQATYKRLPEGWKFVKINNMFGEVVDIQFGDK